MANLTSEVVLLAQAEPSEAEVHAEDELHATTEADGGEHSSVFPPFDPASFGPQLIWLAITFAILYVGLSRMALPRIGGILENRKSRVDADLAAADQSRQRTDAAIADYEKTFAEARERSQALAAETRSAVKADIDGKRHAIEADLSKRMAEAEKSIQATKTTALAHVDEIATDTVQALVEQLTGPVTPQQAREAVDAALKE